MFAKAAVLLSGWNNAKHHFWVRTVWSGTYAIFLCRQSSFLPHASCLWLHLFMGHASHCALVMAGAGVNSSMQTSLLVACMIRLLLVGMQSLEAQAQADKHLIA